MTTAQEILQLQEDNLDLKIEYDNNCKKINELDAANKVVMQKWLYNHNRIQKLMPKHDRQNSTRSV